MDIETVKSVISAAAAIVAVISAALAYRARVQTRTDIFEAQRDALVLAMAENDIRCDDLRLQAVRAKSAIEHVLPNIGSAKDQDDAKAYLGSIREIEELSELHKLRQYSPAALDELSYSEEALATLRRIARGEQVNSKHLQAASYDLVFQVVDSFVKQHEPKT